MEDQPLISVVIPAHNAELSLERCLQSVFEQEYPQIEVIVVDDGSEDSTSAIAQSYGDQIIFVSQENKGQGAARNHGIRLATGELITFLDSDDYWKPGFLKVCSAFLNEHPEVVAVNTAFTIVLRDGTEKTAPILEETDLKDSVPRVLEDFFAFWAKYDHVRTGTCVMRTQTVRDLGGQCEDLRISQDLEFWGMLATRGPWGFIPESYWVGDSRIVSRKSGFRKKYAQRRKLCPSVEQWERRLKDAISEKDRVHFERVRGRVAAGYMHAKIIGGDLKGARQILRDYGNSMPPSTIKRILSFASRFGYLGWRLGVAMIQARERLK